MIKVNPQHANILIIEDNEEFNVSLGKMLKRRGYGVVQALNGRDGIKLAHEAPPDLIIADILLPDIDGLRVILEIQKKHPGIKIIAISGGGHCASGEEYLDDVQLLCNVEYTLSKPFHRDELLATISEALS